MRRIHIVGRKNSGKTTLIVDLVSHFAGRGLRVGAIKHTHHRHELDTPGKDSFRHRQAGACAVGVLSPGMTAVFLPSASGERGEDRYQQLAPLLGDCDLVLVEGDLMTAAPKVEVWRAELGVEPYATEHRSILALITDDAVGDIVPIWPRRIDVLAEKLLGLHNQVGDN
jgi:molybdopterin-guanine dinucleotide biosynthesis protein B